MAFQTLRERLVLAFPYHRRSFILDTDASEAGIGTVISQVHEYGQECVVAFVSKVLLKSKL